MIENAISTDSFSSQAEFSTRGQDFNHVDVSTSTGSVKTTIYNLNVLNQLAMVCIDNEIILGNFKGKESLPLANRGNTFVSLRRVLEILSKTELSSDIVDNFQTECRTAYREHPRRRGMASGFSYKGMLYNCR